MKQRAPGLMLGLLLLAVAAGAQQPPKAALMLKAVVGQTSTYKEEANISLEGGGRSVTFNVKSTSQSKVTVVSPEGNITRESSTLDYVTEVMGRKLPTPDDILKSKKFITERPNGSLAAVKSEGSEETPESRSESNRIDQATRMIFTSTPVGPGDKWTHDFVEERELGTFTGRSQFELLGFEKAKGIECAKIKFTYAESGGPGPKITSTSAVFVERSSGDTVVADVKLENVPFGPEGAPPAKASIHQERVSGSPIGITGTDPQGTTPAATALKKEKTIEEVVKDYEKLTGLFTLYRKKDQGRDTLYLEVREDQFKQLMFLQTTASTGAATNALAAGEPINDLVFRMEQRDEQVLFIVPNGFYEVDPSKPINKAVQRSFTDSIVEALRVEARSAERKSVLVNVSDLFRGDFARITQAASQLGGGYGIERDKTIYTSIKMFPENLAIQTSYSLSRSGGGGLSALGIPGAGGLPAGQADPRNLSMKVNYALSIIPGSYQTRAADPRIGYFTTDFQDFSEDEERQMRRYILRWRLEKSDPRAAMSTPKKPIVFWLDNAIPTQYRDAVKSGLLLWNSAFEKLGFKDAVVVKQMPDDADWDHADVRYNVIRWVTSPSSAYAVAQFRANPMTGEILNAAITVDANLTRVMKTEFKHEVDPLAALKDPVRTADKASRLRCTYAQEAAANAYQGMLARTLLVGSTGTKISDLEYTRQFLTSVVAHEMGHIMGLRHNFAGSTQQGLKSLANGDVLRRQGVVASVMDYVPYNPMAIHHPNGQYWTNVLGGYDLWAIEYGYTTAAGKDTEKSLLATIASRSNWPGHAYESDETADSWDPFVTRFDLAQNPLDYWSVILTDSRSLMQRIPQAVPARGESYYQLTKQLLGTLAQTSTASRQISRFIGGLRLNRNHKGDAREKAPLAPIPAGDQEQALELLRRNIFSADAFPIATRYLSYLAPDPQPDMIEAFTGTLRQDSPIRDTMSGIQKGTLQRLMSSATLQRIANNEFKADKAHPTLGLDRLYSVLAGAVWEEARTAKPVPGLRRDLQRTYLQAMTEQVLRADAGVPEDGRMLARHHLKELRSQLKSALPKIQDRYTRIHFGDSIEQISRVLDARVNISAPAPGGGGGVTIRRGLEP